VIKQKLTLQLVLDKLHHGLLAKLVKRHKIWLAKGAFVVEQSFEPFQNQGGRNNSTIVSDKVCNILTI
jgi:hypothetical protein